MSHLPMSLENGMPSLLYITIDCLRADHVGFLGYGRNVTPNLDRLAEKSIVFSNALAAGTPTYYAFPALLAGRFPLARGRDVIGLCPGETTLASHLRDLGYRTGALVAGNPYLSRWMGYDEGFDFFEDFLGNQPENREKDSCRQELGSFPSRLNQFLHRLARVSSPLASCYEELYFNYCLWITGLRANWDFTELLNSYPRADVITDRAIDWLKSRSRPFFLWLHYMDAHQPYCPPGKMLEQLGRNDLSLSKQFRLRHLWLRDLPARRLWKYRQDLLYLYDACIAGIDSQVGRLLEALENRDNFSNTIIVLTADHGEAFLERGERYH
jgi:arylsulfatase A-like enzyme